MTEHIQDGLLQTHTSEIHRRGVALHRSHIAMHFGRLAQQHIHGHVHRMFQALDSCKLICQNQLALFGGNTYYRKRTTLSLAKRFE